MNFRGKVSIVRYMMTYCLLLIALFSLFTVVAVNFMADRAEEQTIRNKMSRQLRATAWRMSLQDGKLTLLPSKKIDTRLDEDFEFVILDQDGKVVFGEYPEDLKNLTDKIKENEFQTIKTEQSVYYVLDKSDLLNRILRVKDKYRIRGMINEDDIKTVYSQFKLYSYIGVAGAVVLVILMGMILQKQISVPMRDMCEQASQISEKMDLSERMEYSGKFEELDVLIKAYNSLLRKMEEVVERQEHFNSDVSHELRTPISVIRAQCQLTSGQLRQSKDVSVEKVIEVIDRQADKMDGIVEQMLSLSRIDQGRWIMNFDRVDLVDIIESVCEDEEDRGKHPFVYHLKHVFAEVDIDLITLVVRNLVSNASKYSEDGKTIVVDCGEDGNRVFIRVKDFGCGISEKDLPRIFEYYYRAEKSRNSEGFGLGLTIALKIARLHGGEIRVESEPGFGSAFTLFIEKERSAILIQPALDQPFPDQRRE